METQIAKIGTLPQSPLSSTVFGGKASGLAKLAEKGFSVPEGVCLSIDATAQIYSSGEFTDDQLEELKLLLSRRGSKGLIVRSSSMYEDANLEKSFSGVFESVHGVESLDQLVGAIVRVCRSTQSEKARLYFKHNAIDPNIPHLGIIVQEEIDAEVSALVAVGRDEVRIEAILGGGRKLNNGAGIATTFVLDIETGKIRRISGNISEEAILPLISWIKRYSELLANSTSSISVLEVGQTSGSVFTLQSKQSIGFEPATNRKTLYKSKSVAPDGTEMMFTSKAVAMQVFSEKGLFDLPATVLKPGSSIEVIRAAVESILSRSEHITIRYSKSHAIGLPRGFARTVDEAMTFIAETITPVYGVILHQYMDVTNSFELLVDRDKMLVEHVPGMWESDNQIQPDVLHFSTRGVDVLRFNGSKTSIKVGLTPEERGEVAERGAFLISPFMMALTRIWAIARESRDIALPVNIHAVWDGKSNSIQCINFRPGFKDTWAEVPLNDAHVVSSLRDMDYWNGIDPVRLSLRSARGAEAELVPLAQRLADVRIPVFVDFGLLSHPAMVLRDFGVSVFPTYRSSLDLVRSEYERLYFSREQLSPITRIYLETAIKSTDAYIVVSDAEPIVDGHAIGVSLLLSASSKDTDRIEEVASILSSFDINTFYFERGRASFCTSAFERAHDHFHLVPGIDDEATCSTLRATIGSTTRYRRLEDAYQDVPEFGEYVVFGSRSAGFHLSKGRFYGKRLLRSSVVELKKLHGAA